MRPAAAACTCVLALMAHAKPVRAQAALEYGLGAAKAAGASGAISNVGKKVSGLAEGIEKTVRSKSPAPATRRFVGPRAPAPEPAAPPASVAAAPAYEDLSKLEVGLGYADLVRRFGPPAIEIAASTGKTLTYSRAGCFTQIEIRNDRVAAILK